MRTVLVVGGGFAGVQVALGLIARAIPACEIFLVSERREAAPRHVRVRLPDAVPASVGHLAKDGVPSCEQSRDCDVSVARLH